MRAGAIGPALVVPVLLAPVGLLSEGIAAYGAIVLGFTAILLNAGFSWRREQNRHAEVQEIIAKAPSATMREIAEALDALNGRRGGSRGGRAVDISDPHSSSTI